MKAYARIAAFLLALVAVATLFSACTDKGTTDAGNASPSDEPTPSVESPAPQLSVGDELSMPVFEW
jgi:hypothetical protein